MWRFNKFTNNLIIKILNICPRNAFALVLFLLLLQNELDKELLKFLVAVIYAELNREEEKFKLIS